MGLLCSKVSITAIAPGNTSSSSRKLPTDPPGSKDGNSGGSNVFGGPVKEFLHPFGSSYSHRGDSLAWQYVRQMSMVHAYIEVPFAEWIETKMEQLHEEELQRLLMVFRQQAQVERQYYLMYPHHNARKGLLGMFGGNTATSVTSASLASTAKAPSMLINTNTAESLSEAEVAGGAATTSPGGTIASQKSTLQKTTSRAASFIRAYSQRTTDTGGDQSSVSGDGEAWQAQSSSTANIEGVGHIWRRLSLHTYQSLFHMFPHIYTATNNLQIHLDTSEDELAYVEQEANYTIWSNWKKVVFEQLPADENLTDAQRRSFFQQGLITLERNQFYQIFFLLDIIYGYHILVEHALKYHGNMQKLAANQWPKCGQDVIFKDFVVLISILMHGKVEDWLVMLLLTFAQLDIEHFLPPTSAATFPSGASITSMSSTNSANQASSVIWEHILFDEQQIVSIVIYILIMWQNPTQGNSRVYHLPQHKHYQLAIQFLTYAASQQTVPSSSASVASSSSVPTGQKYSLAHIVRMITADGDDFNSTISNALPTSKIWLLFIELMQSLNEEAMRTVFYPLLYDIVQNPYEHGRKVIDEYHLSTSIEHMNFHMKLFHRYNYSLHATSATTTALTSLTSQGALQATKTKGATKKLAANTKLILSSVDKDLVLTSVEMFEIYRLLLTSSSFQGNISHIQPVRYLLPFAAASSKSNAPSGRSTSSTDCFVIEANWWELWCQFMQLTAIYGSSTMEMIHQDSDGDSAHTLVKEASDIILNPTLECVVIGVKSNITSEIVEFHSENYISSLYEAFFHNPLQPVAYDSLPNLNNAMLLLEPMPGFFQLLSSAVLQPRRADHHPQADGNKNVVEFVAVPFAIGKMLYEFYDPSARVIPPAVFKTTLMYCNKEINSGSIATPSVVDVHSSAVDAFVTNFSSSTHAISPDLLLYRDSSAPNSTTNGSSSYANFILNVSPNPPMTKAVDTISSKSADTDAARHSGSSIMFNTAIPIYFCTKLGIATNQPIDTAYIAYNTSYAKLNNGQFDIRYMHEGQEKDVSSLYQVPVNASIAQYMAHLLSKYYHVNTNTALKDDPTTDDVLATHRMWGMVHVSTYTSMLSKGATRRKAMAFTKDYCWVLLTPEDCLLALIYQSSARRSSTSVTRLPLEYHIVGLMLENAFHQSSGDEESAWPSDRVVHNILAHHIDGTWSDQQKQKDMVIEDLEETAETDKVMNHAGQVALFVGMNVDYLTEELTYSQATITHIDRNTIDLHIAVYEEFYMYQEDVILTLKDCITHATMKFPMKSLRLLLVGTITMAYHANNSIFTEIDFSKTKPPPNGRAAEAQYEQVVWSTTLRRMESEANYEKVFGLFEGMSQNFAPADTFPMPTEVVEHQNLKEEETIVKKEDSTVILKPDEFTSTRKIITITEDGDEDEEDEEDDEDYDEEEDDVEEDEGEENEQNSANEKVSKKSKQSKYSKQSKQSKRSKQSKHASVHEKSNATSGSISLSSQSLSKASSAYANINLLLDHHIYRVLSQSYATYAYLLISQYNYQIVNQDSNEVSSMGNLLPVVYIGSGGIAQVKYVLHVMGIQLQEFDPQATFAFQQTAHDDTSIGAGSSITNSLRGTQPQVTNVAVDETSVSKGNNQEASVEMPSVSNASNTPSKQGSRMISLPRRRSVSADKRGHSTVNMPKQFERWGIIGLNNMGNTCFFSSAMQCLLHHPSLVSSMLSFIYLPYTNVTSKLGSKGKVLEEFAKFVQAVYRCHSNSTIVQARGGGGGASQRSLASNGGGSGPASQVFTSFPTLSPTSLWKAFQSHKTQFNGHDQQDAQEFLAELLDTLHEDTKFQSRYHDIRKESRMARYGKAEESIEGNMEETRSTEHVSNPTVRLPPHRILYTYQQLLQEGRSSWYDYYHQQNSIIASTCTGMLCTNVVCNHCHAVSKKFEPFNMLSLPLPSLHGGPGAGGGGQHGSSTASSLQGNYQVNVVLTFARKLPRFYYIIQAHHWLQHVVSHVPVVANKAELRNRLTELWKQITAQHEGNMSTSQKLFRIAFTMNANQNVEQMKRVCIQAYLDTMLQRDGSDGNEEEIEALIQSTTMILGHEDETYRIRKILDNKDTIQGIVEEVPSAVNVANDNSMELLLIENNKDLTFIGKLSARRLSQDVHESFHIQWMTALQTIIYQPVPSGSDEACMALMEDTLNLMSEMMRDNVLLPLESTTMGIGDSSQALTSNWYYPDSNEYQLFTVDPATVLPSLSDNLLYSSGLLASQGKLICDTDNIYGPVAPAVATPAVVTSSPSNGLKKKSKANFQPLQPSMHLRIPNQIPQSPPNRWPKTMWDFTLHDRVDALDHKGHWYPGSIVQLVYSTSSGLHNAAPPPKYQPTVQLNKKMHSIYSNTKPSAELVAQMTERDLRYYKCFIRVHFDHFSQSWDEWYDEEDFQKGLVQPIYTHTSRKLKIFDIQMIQRKLYYYRDDEEEDRGPPVAPVPASSQAAAAAPKGIILPSQTSTKPSISLGKMEVLPNPHIVQVESYRSAIHGYQHIVEQMLRYLTSDDWQLLLTASDGADPHKLLPNLAEKLPFRVRLLNMQNMHVAPLNEESIDSQARNALAASSPTVTANKILSRLPPGGKGKELFLQYKTWEGTLYPFQDERRPMANVFHNKLVVSIDWEYLVVSEDDLLARAPSSPVPSLLPSPTSLSSLAQRTEDVLKKHSSQQMQFPVNDDGEYIMPLHLLHSECDIPKEISPVMQFIDHASFVDYQIKTMKNQRLLTSSSTASTTTGSVGKSQDQRIGLTIEQVLQDYMASEVIPDYHCDNCSTTKPSNGAMLANKGTLYTSISALPDTLILHLKRLVINATGGSKIRTLVKFPIQGLDMSTFTLEHFSRQRYRDDMITEGYLDDLPDMQAILKLLAAHDTNVVYDLFGVVNHMGGMFGGHYTAYVLCEDISYATTTGSIAGGPAELRMREYLTQVGISNQPLPTPTLNGPGLNAAQLSTTIPFLQPPAVSENGHDGNKRWYKFDDEFVHDLQYPTSYTGYPANLGQSSTGMPAANVEQTIVSESAYILFYQRRNLSVTHMLPFL